MVLLAAAFFVIFAFILLPNSDIRPIQAADVAVMNAVEGDWWSYNGGWIQMNEAADYGVRIHKNANPVPVFVGYAWGPNIGWINMEGTYEGGTYGVALREAYKPDPHSYFCGSPAVKCWHVDGDAWGWNVGWLDFDAIDSAVPSEQPRLMMQSVTAPGSSSTDDALLRGYAWSPNIGWVKLDSNIPGWQDSQAPRLEYFDVQPEDGWPLPPAYKYQSGVYKDVFDYATAAWNFRGDGRHLVWVKAGSDFKVQMHSTDKNTRWHDLNVSAVVSNNAPPPADYYWWDRLKFSPTKTPNYFGSIHDPVIGSGLAKSGDYAAGANPAAVEPVPDVSDPDHIVWKSVSHLATYPPFVGSTVYEFRYNVRDGGGNQDCSAADFDWEAGEGCVLPLDLGDEDSPMEGRAGLGIDADLPGVGTLKTGLGSGVTTMSTDEANPSSVIPFDRIPFTAEYIDDQSGSYHVIIEYQWKAGAAWPLVWGGTIGERRWNLGRMNVTWQIDGNLDAGPYPEGVPAPDYQAETRFDTKTGHNTGDRFRIRMRMIDNVGNQRDVYYYGIVGPVPVASFELQDPLDNNKNRTRYNAVDIQLPVSDVWGTMKFKNRAEDLWPQGEGEAFVSGGRKESWSLGDDSTGGIKKVYAQFCYKFDTSQCEEVTDEIYAAWLQGFQGDVYGRSGVGVREPGMTGNFPYQGRYNATYRITSGGEIKPQFTSQWGEASGSSAWSEEDYIDFTFPGPAGSVAEIDWSSLSEQAVELSDENVAKTGLIDFTDPSFSSGVVKLTPGLSKSDVYLWSQNSDRVLIKGKGTLLIDGNLRVLSNLYYEDGEKLANPTTISSLGVITRSSNAARGNVYVHPGVGHMVGAYIVGLNEIVCPVGPAGCGVFHSAAEFGLPASGSPLNVGSVSPKELVLDGMVAARDFNLGRFSTGWQNYLNNPDLETYPRGQFPPRCPESWSCDPYVNFWGITTNPVYGNHKLRVGPGALSYSFRQANVDISAGAGLLVAQRYLTLSGYIRSSNTISGGLVNLAVQAGAETKPCAVDVDSQWRRFQCTVPVAAMATRADVSVLVSFPGPDFRNFWLDYDAWQLEEGQTATEWHDKFGAATNYMSSERFYYDGRVILNTPPGLAPLQGPSWGETVAD